MDKAFEELQIKDDVTSEMKKLLDFINGKESEDDFTRGSTVC